MNPTRHKARHKLLHQHLDELVADYFREVGYSGINNSVLDLLSWSASSVALPKPYSTIETNPHPVPRLRGKETKNGQAHSTTTAKP